DRNVTGVQTCALPIWPIADGIGQDLGGFLIFFLQCDDAALGTGGLHQLAERPDDVVGVVKHVMLVGVQKGLAFAAVGDNRVGVGDRKSVGGGQWGDAR